MGENMGTSQIVDTKYLALFFCSVLIQSCTSRGIGIPVSQINDDPEPQELNPDFFEFLDNLRSMGRYTKPISAIEKDECNRPETTLDGLASLKPVFDPENGSVTAG